MTETPTSPNDQPETLSRDPGTQPFWSPGWFEHGPAIKQKEGREVTYLEAIRFALWDELQADSEVVLLGEDIGEMGGAFRVTEGLQPEFGEARVIDTPLAETALVGAGIGLAVMGMRPIVELQFADFISCAYDQLVTEAAKLHYRFGIEVPLVVRAPSGAGVGAGPFHSQSPEGVFATVPGLKVVCPGTVQDAYDLLRWAVADNNPVLFFEHKALYRSIRAELRRHNERIDPWPVVRRAGRDITLVTYGGMADNSLEAADLAAEERIEVEVIDLRLLAPLNLAEVFESVARTSRLLVVHEDSRSSGVGNLIASTIAEQRLWTLDAPILQVTAPDTPVPFAPELEEAYLPGVGSILRAVRALAEC